MPKAVELGVRSVEQVVSETYRIEGIKRKTKKEEELVFCCPVHPDSNPSAGIGLTTGLWSCLSCGAKGDLATLGVKILKITRSEALALLRPNNPAAHAASIQRRLYALRNPATGEVVERGHQTSIPPLSEYQKGPYTELVNRGFNISTLKRWGVRFAPKVEIPKVNGKMMVFHKAIAIPIFDEQGILRAWCYRATKESDAWFQKTRYLYTAGVVDVLNRSWFGMNMYPELSEITVCEGTLDAMWCDQHGIPAIAIMGSQVGDYKLNKLLRYRQVTLFTDRDRAGVLAAQRLGALLCSLGVCVRVVRYPPRARNRSGDEAKDPQDLSSGELLRAHSRSIPFLAWKHRAIKPSTESGEWNGMTGSRVLNPSSQRK